MSFARPCSNMADGGFTLVEMAVVVVIAGIILGALLPAVLDMRRATQLTATQTNLQSLLRVTAAYVQANGCLPCPTPSGVANGGLGHVRGDVRTSPPVCGVCAQPDGIVPFVSLGIDPVVAKDGWGRWITMHIDPLLAQNPIPSAAAVADSVVPPQAACTSNDVTAGTPGCTATCSTTDAAFGNHACKLAGQYWACTANDVVQGVQGCHFTGQSRKGLCREGLSKNDSVAISFLPSNPQAFAAVIFVSHGVNGVGSYNALAKNFPLNARLGNPPPCQPLRPESCNADGDRNFYLLDRGELFDDVIVYADRNALVSMFGSGACQTAW